MSFRHSALQAQPFGTPLNCKLQSKRFDLFVKQCKSLKILGLFLSGFFSAIMAQALLYRELGQREKCRQGKIERKRRQRKSFR
jgi:hypothetical protein